MSSQGTLGAATQDRKARLAQLKSLKRKQPEPSDDAADAPSMTDKENIDDNDVTRTYLSGRNYDPETRGPKLGFESAPNASLETLEKRAADLEIQTKALAVVEEETKDAPIDLFKLQPKKPNWDLKRDLKERMEVLDVKTNNAIARLVKERLEGQKKLEKTADGEEVAAMDGDELVQAVHARERMEEEQERREKELDAEMDENT